MIEKIREKLSQGQPVLGTFFSMGNASAMECLGYTGLDYAIIDTEHGPFDTQGAMELVRAAENVGLCPFMRIADVTHKEIQRAVDIGAQGLIVPCLRSLEDIRRLVDLAKYPPVGNRGYITGRGSGFGNRPWAQGSVARFMSNANDRVMVLPQCETVECLEAIEDAAAIPGVDGIFIGPFDLSISMGIPGQFQDPAFLSALDRILAACKAVNKPCFIFTTTAEKARDYLAQGFDAVAHSIDFTILTQAYKAEVEKILAK